jgi:hypothetical protein
LTVTRGTAYSATKATLTVRLPPQPTQIEFNVRRWTELLADPDPARFEGRVGTDRYGDVLMSPPPTTADSRPASPSR